MRTAVTTLLLTLSLTLGTVALAAAAGLFLEDFNLGAPTAPLTYSNPNGWDIFPSGLDTRQNGTWAQRAHHGPDRGGAQTSHGPLRRPVRLYGFE